MRVSELMNPRVAKVGPKTPLAEILELMLRSHLNDAVVVDRKDKLLGIVTYGDLSRRLLPSQQELVDHEEYLTDPGLMEDRVEDIASVPVEEIMTKKVITVSPESHAIKAGSTDDRPSRETAPGGAGRQAGRNDQPHRHRLGSDDAVWSMRDPEASGRIHPLTGS
jgi:hypothetical protein